MNIKTVSAALIATALVATACSSKKDESASPAADKTAPPNGEKLSLYWMVSSPPNATLPSPDKDFVKKAIEEKFNVELKIDYMPIGADYTNKLNTMLAGGNAPDLFVSEGTATQKYTLDGVLADMSPYVNPTAMPNYFKWVDEKTVKYYQMRGLNVFSRAPLPYTKMEYVAYYIRKDWLDNLGLKMPQTYDELMNVMRAFTNNDPDGNGKKDTYGFSASAGGGRLPFDFPQWIQYGLVGTQTITDESYDDNQTSLRLQPVLQGVIDMMKEGIVDPDWFVNKHPTHLDKAAQGKVGVIRGADRTIALEGVPNSLQSKTKALFPKADWQPFHPYGNKSIWTEAGPGHAFVIAKSVAEKKPEHVKRSIQIWDWLASEEGFLLTHYGQEGKHYKREGNKITLIPEAIDADIAKNGNFLAVYAFFTPDEPKRIGLEVIDPRMSERDRNILKFVESLPKDPAFPITASPPPGMNIADFRKAMAEMQIKVIFEDKDASTWPARREELMTKYKGREIFQGYQDQYSEATGHKFKQPFK